MALITGVATAGLACNSYRNGWLDPTVLGNFKETRTTEIRNSLTLEDMPMGIPGAMLPRPDDLIVKPVEPRISPGDSLAVEIFELRQPLVPFQVEVLVTAKGHVNLPVLGRVPAGQLTAEELERELVRILRERDILIDPEVTVNPIFLQNATYSIFGIGVSAANNAPLRAGTFPIRRPGLRILEAINQVGGLNEFIAEVYVFRNETDEHSNTGAKTPRHRGQGHPGAFLGARVPESNPLGARRKVKPVGAGRALRQLSPEEELVSVVVDPEERPSFEKIERPPAIEPATPAPEPTQPYVWVGDEFVPNPAYKPTVAVAAQPTIPSGNTAVPTVDWDRVAGDVSYRILRIPGEMLRSGAPQVNVVVRPGDVIRITSGEIGIYYVMGQVNSVGAFRFNAEPITLKAAIAAAGGLSGLAWPSRCTVYRRVGQREQMIQVDLDKIFAGKDADFMIRRGDIINVGTHPFAPFLQRIRGLTLPNPLSTVGYSFTYARNYADIDSFSVRTNPHNEPDRFPGLFP